MNQDMVFITAADTNFLYALYQWGINVIKLIQQIETPSLTAFIQTVTNLGNGVFYVAVFLIVFWCVDEKKGLHLGILVLLSAWLNGLGKNLLKQPRPFNLDPLVGRGFESSYGFPSGHAQLAVTFWIPVASWIGGALQRSKNAKIVIWSIAFFIILFISFTRIYLGLHFPTDILGGWLAGSVIVVFYFLLARPLEHVLIAGGTRLQMISAAMVALLINALGTYQVLGGLFLGFSLGYSLMQKQFPFSAQSRINGRKPGLIILVMRCILGSAGMGIIYVGLRMVLPGESSLFAAIPSWGSDSPYYTLGRFIQHGALGIWISGGAPWFFLRMGLASTPQE